MYPAVLKTNELRNFSCYYPMIFRHTAYSICRFLGKANAKLQTYNIYFTFL